MIPHPCLVTHDALGAWRGFFMQARYYDPVIGRFLSNDPVGFSVDRPQMFGRYTYVGNDPLNATDPTGEIIETLWDAANVVAGVASAVGNVAQGNFGAAAVDVAGVGVDLAATIIPGAPGGAAAGIKATRAAGAAADAGRSRGKADFIVNSDGAAVRNSPSGARSDLEAGGLSGTNVTNRSGTETGTLHNSPGQGTDIRIMDGGPNHGPRAVTTRQGSNQPVNAATGRNFGNVSKQEESARSHIELDPDG